MTIFIGSDHNGFEYKQQLRQQLEASGHRVIDCGDEVLNPEDDYPVFAARLVQALLASKDIESKGILICGSGQGMCMAANRFKGIRASLCWNVAEAKAARNDDDSNVLCLASRQTSQKDAVTIIEAFISTPFAAAHRFNRRIQQLDELT